MTNMIPLTVDLFLPRRTGGVTNWGDALKTELTELGIKATIYRGEFAVIWGSLFGSGRIRHATVPLIDIRKTPMVLTIHGDLSRQKNVWIRFYDSLIRTADVITVPSQYLKDLLPNAAAYQVIPNGILIDRYRPIAREAPGRPAKILTVTSFQYPEKAWGLRKLTDILNQVHPRHPVELTVVGAGSLFEEVSNTCSEAAAFPITFVGWQDAVPYYQSHDLFAYYSDQDTGPLVLLEAMASGLPCVINNVGMAPEVIQTGQNGFIADSMDNFVSYCCELLKGRELFSSVSKRASERAALFSARKMAEDFSKIYEDLMKRQGEIPFEPR